jgi:hypothetical protein
VRSGRGNSRFAVALRRALAFEGRLVDEGTGLRGRVSGTVGPDRRPASVTFTTERGEAVAQFAVSVRMAPLIRLSRENVWTRLGKLLRLKKEIEVGDAGFDDLLLVEVASPKRARDVLVRGVDARRRIVEAFSVWNATKLVVGRPNIVATIPLAAVPKVGDYVSFLDLLVGTAAALDRVTIEVRVLGGERFALSGVHGRPRCAYCHADVTGREPDLVACGRCGTVLHEACWNELGRCALLGCPGDDVERARARA